MQASTISYNSADIMDIMGSMDSMDDRSIVQHQMHGKKSVESPEHQFGKSVISSNAHSKNTTMFLMIYVFCRTNMNASIIANGRMSPMTEERSRSQQVTSGSLISHVVFADGE